MNERTVTDFQSLIHSLTHNWMALVGALMLMSVIILAVFAPWFAPYDPKASLKGQDGCECYQVLSELVESRRTLIHVIECLADNEKDDTKTKALAAEKTNHSMLFADLERYCHNRKKADTCATQAIYQQRKNALFTESANRVICKPADLPDLFGPKTEEP